MRAGAEVVEIPVGAGRVVLVVAGRRIRATLEPSPGRGVRRPVVAERTVAVLVVAEREDGPRSDPAYQPSGLPMTQARCIGTCDVTRRNDHGVRQRDRGAGRRERGRRQGEEGCQGATEARSSEARHRPIRLQQLHDELNGEQFPRGPRVQVPRGSVVGARRRSCGVTG